MDKNVLANVSQIVAVLLPSRGANGAGGVSYAELMHAELWPYVKEAVEMELSARDDHPGPIDGNAQQTVTKPSDRRVRPWQYAARFWMDTENGPELIGETDPETIQGTGELPIIIANLAAELHGGTPDELKPDAVKARLPQLRNNLGRNNTAALRIPYVIEQMRDTDLQLHDVNYLCQVDVYRLET